MPVVLGSGGKSPLPPGYWYSHHASSALKKFFASGSSLQHKSKSEEKEYKNKKIKKITLWRTAGITPLGLLNVS